MYAVRTPVHRCAQVPPRQILEAMPCTEDGEPLQLFNFLDAQQLQINSSALLANYTPVDY